MKILNIKKSRGVIQLIFRKFGYDGDDFLDNYLKTSPFVAPFKIGGFDKSSFLDLQYITKGNIQIIGNIWERFLVIDNQPKGKYWLEIIYDQLSKELIRLYPGEVIFGVGNWDLFSEIGHRAIELDLFEIGNVIEKYADAAVYFYPKGLNWILIISTNGHSYFAGEEKIIQKVKL